MPPRRLPFPFICLIHLVITLFGNSNGVLRAEVTSTGVENIWVSALDEQQVQRHGKWQETSFRYAARRHLYTTSDGAALEFPFRGTGVVIRLGAHAVPAYGVPNRGKIMVKIDGELNSFIHPLETDREIVIAWGLDNKEHLLRLEHQAKGSETGCRIEGFRPIDRSSGDLLFNLNGEENAFLVDARALLSKDGRIVRNTLVRNWMTGQCSLAGLTPGKRYALEVRATGWKPVQVDDISIDAGRSMEIDPIFLERDPSTVINRFRFPALNRQAIRKPSQTFRARFLGFQAEIGKITLTRTVGPAVISRSLKYEEDKAAAYYYDREIIATLPEDMPPGLYDLSIEVKDSSPGGRRTGICRSPRSVHVVNEFPTDPVLVTFGHLDTSGQYQGEYLQRLASMTNLLAPDLVLNSTAVNPAYISGALAALDMPYVINFGNHQFYGHEKWYGDPVGLVPFGPDLAILNFGHPWHDDRSMADALLASIPDCRHKIINAFEANAPIKWLDKHHICMIHDAHGTGEKNVDFGATPTRRVGKVNAVSFRVVRLKDGRVVSSTYKKPRGQTHPLWTRGNPATTS